MNKIITLIKTVLVTLTLTVAASANTYSEKEYVGSFAGRTDIPVPVKVETPSIGESYAGEIIKVSFVVDTAGKVENVKIVSPLKDEDAKAAIIDALNKWEFKPLVKNGSAVSTIVELPLKVVAN